MSTDTQALNDTEAERRTLAPILGEESGLYIVCSLYKKAPTGFILGPFLEVIASSYPS